MTSDPTPCSPSDAGPAILRFRLWWNQLPVLLLAALVLLPIGHMLSVAITASRNVVYWDEFETALALVLKLKEGTTP